MLMAVSYTSRAFVAVLRSRKVAVDGGGRRGAVPRAFGLVPGRPPRLRQAALARLSRRESSQVRRAADPADVRSARPVGRRLRRLAAGRRRGPRGGEAGRAGSRRLSSAPARRSMNVSSPTGNPGGRRRIASFETLH